MAAILLLQQQGGGSILPTLALWVPLILLFWVFIIVPQRRQAKTHRTMVDSLQKGDQVVTLGGLVGEIAQVKDNVVMLRTGQAVVAVERERIARRTGGPGAAPAADAKK